jgi:hypothetical protein
MAWTEKAVPLYTENSFSKLLFIHVISYYDSIYIKLRSNKLVIILGLSEPEDERVRAFEASGTIY